jgi:mRNA interferase RelE/StbE
MKKLLPDCSAKKELEKLPRPMHSKIVSAVDNLSSNPYPEGVRKLVGSENSYRIRIGDYRVLYSIIKNRLIAEIIRVAHRKDIYRGINDPR